MYRFQHIDETNVNLVKDFLLALGKGVDSFRYFTKRPIEVVLNHLLTIVMVNEQNAPLAYGHLDKESNNLWLGIAVAEQAQGLGLGKQMLQFLIDEAKSHGEAMIMLTVDKSNFRAIHLYETHGFVQTAETNYYYQYLLVLT